MFSDHQLPSSTSTLASTRCLVTANNKQQTATLLQFATVRLTGVWGSRRLRLSCRLSETTPRHNRWKTNACGALGVLCLCDIELPLKVPYISRISARTSAIDELRTYLYHTAVSFTATAVCRRVNPNDDLRHVSYQYLAYDKILDTSTVVEHRLNLRYSTGLHDSSCVCTSKYDTHHNNSSSARITASVRPDGYLLTVSIIDLLRAVQSVGARRVGGSCKF